MTMELNEKQNNVQKLWQEISKEKNNSENTFSKTTQT